MIIVFFNDSNVGLHLYSDSSVSNSEFTGGSTPIKIVAGGNRLVNIWANTGSDTCVELSPFNSSTTHINTSITNLYAGEVSTITSKPIIKIVGTAAQKVQQVQISNSHIVNATNVGSSINGGIYCDYVENSVFSNIAFYGLGDYATATTYTEYFMKFLNSNGVGVSNCSFYKCNKNSVYVGNGCSNLNISNNTFNEFGTHIGTGNECAGIYIASGFVTVSDNSFNIGGSQTAPFACYSASSDNVFYSGNLVRYPSAYTLVVGSGEVSTISKAYGNKPIIYGYDILSSTLTSTCINNSKQNYLLRGQINVSGGNTGTLTTLSSLSENQSYLISVRQSGLASNVVVGYIFAFNGSASALRIVQDNTNPVLDMQLSTSGASINLTIGSGFGFTTWDWVLTRIG